MSKITILIIFLTFIYSCSLDTKTGLWTKSEKIKKEDSITKEIFKKTKVYDDELNTNVTINLKTSFIPKSFINNLSNNNGHINYDGSLKKVSKYKFSKIKQFKYTQPELLFTENKSIIFFNNEGTILNFDLDSNLMWKKNYYSKNEKKLNPILFFASNNKILVVTDNISKYYAINLKNGELIWLKNNSAPFNSQIKIFEDKFFAIDFDNVLRCYSIRNGKLLWSFKTDKSFIKSQQKLSIVVDKNKVIFVNTLGDITSLNINTGNLLWQTPTQSSLLYENAFSLKNSDLIVDKNSIYLSNNRNEFFSVNADNGLLQWKQKINSSLRPTRIGNLIFSVSSEGYLIILDSRNGNIIRMTNILYKFKDNKIEPTGFIVAKGKIYLSLNNGRLIVADIFDSKLREIIKIDDDKISRPYVLDKNMYLIKNNAIIRLK